MKADGLWSFADLVTPLEWKTGIARRIGKAKRTH